MYQNSLILSAQSNPINLNNGQILNTSSIKLTKQNPNGKIIQFGEFEIECW
jgi:hypothetical protein